jgi:hypothetical protein
VAYSAQQKRYFARELARSGGNVAAAVAALRNDYEAMREVGESTLRRFIDEIGSGEMIAQEAVWLAGVAADVATQVERERVRHELTGSEFDRIARDESILDDLRELVRSALADCMANKDGAALPISQIAALYERMTRVNDARKERTLPAIASNRDTTTLLRIIAQESLAALGPKAHKFMQSIRDRFIREIAAQESAPPPPAPLAGE